MSENLVHQIKNRALELRHRIEDLEAMYSIDPTNKYYQETLKELRIRENEIGQFLNIGWVEFEDTSGEPIIDPCDIFKRGNTLIYIKDGKPEVYNV